MQASWSRCPTLPEKRPSPAGVDRVPAGRSEEEGPHPPRDETASVGCIDASGYGVL